MLSDSFPDHLSRRHFLRAAPLLAGAPLALRPIFCPGSPESRSLARCAASARNLIFMVSDGMSTGTLTLADTWSRRVLGRPSHWMALMTRDGARRGSAMTHSLDSLVTDSAAGASAWGIGQKVKNHAVNFTANGQTPSPLLLRAAAAGKRTGLVTTTRITHATPAGFFANCPDRDLEDDIATQLIDRRIDVALGGGYAKFRPSLFQARPDLRLVRTRAELNAAPPSPAAPPSTPSPASPAQPVLGLFATEHMSMELDRLANGEASTEPTLAEMTQAALTLLSTDNPRGFILQVEGGRVDHAAHTNDAGSLLREQLAFDEAIEVATRFAAARDDTLLIITSDHGNANPGLTVYGKKASAGFDNLTKARRSFEWLDDQLAKLPTSDQRAAAIGDLAREAAGLPLAADDLALVRRAIKKERIAPFTESNPWTSVLGAVLANSTGISFLSPNHTSDLVEVTAYGPGAAALPPVLDNTDLHTLAVTALGIPA